MGIILYLDGKPHQRQRKLVMPPSMENGCGSTAVSFELTEQMMWWRIGKSFNLFMHGNHSKCSLKCCFGLTEGGFRATASKIAGAVELATSPCWPPSSLAASAERFGTLEPMGRFLTTE